MMGTSAVDEFSRKHAQGELPDQERYYRDLIPAGLPGSGEQFAFEVDLDKCTGCKACVAGCHSLNGLDPAETWRDIGVLQGSAATQFFFQTITTACHHCADPGCLSGCPVVAYEKEADTGVVKHLDDQCIGCQYCTWKCPYEVPKYNPSLGIVRKCDMCIGRLRAGEAPACVQSCPSQAIRITIVKKDEVIERAGRGVFLPDSPDPKITKPSTRYISQREIPAGARAIDGSQLHLKHSHTPLLMMLLVTQAAIGITWFAQFAESKMSAWLALMAFGLVNVGLGVGALHLGRPQYMFRSFLGWKTSWMSREVIAFVAFTTVLAHWAGLSWLPHFVPHFMPEHVRILTTLAGFGSAVTGALALFSSAMIYHDTHKPCWDLRFTLGRFVGTALWIGALSASIIAWVMGAEILRTWLAISLGIGLLKLVHASWEQWQRMTAQEDSPLARSWHTEWTLCRKVSLLKWGGIWISLLCSIPLLLPVGTVLTGVFLLPAMVALVVAEACERYLFFTTEVSAKMPGAHS
jgi:formate dehydrogenase iron-sulfur subunit